MLAEVEDEGRPFNPVEAPAGNLDLPIEQRPIGGLGLHLIRSMMDSLEYRREKSRNVLVMKKIV